VNGKDAHPEQHEESLERRVAALLRAGVVLAVAVVAVGAAVVLARHGHETVNYRVFVGEPPSLRSPAGIVQDALRFRGGAIVELGLLLLILTPVARVALSAVAFLRARDALYAAITAVVLAVLLYSLLGTVLWHVPDPPSSGALDPAHAAPYRSP
jgi:uncharacterized membrane protein